MALVLVLLFLVLPFLELWTIVAVAGEIGLGATLLVLVALSVLGAWLMKHQGLAVWRRAEAELAAGRMPTRSLLDGALVLLGGTLLLVPGFLTDVVGLVLLVPPVRAVLRPVLARAMRRRAERRGGLHAVVIDTVGTTWGTARGQRSPWGTVIGGSVVDVEGTDAAPHAEVVDVRFDEPRELPRPGSHPERPAS